ncbi:GntR family transcriptional regulator [Puniceibacterium sp. IMCC21224]|uniref:GntR family transcriptional regulator n=1 Tax=Puniceibacterium sp. IMCC21224 TaxID=1618204 RepID=UPI00064DCC01|nr:GntR family transcriptional regulator [Puniceibacterium sp. IMCC21224]
MSGAIISKPERLDATAPVGPQLFRLLRGRIVRGDLTPGMRLSEVEVAASYGTSRQPVREAFIKLAEVSLVEVRPQRGSYVSRINVAAVLAAQFVREAVEADIVRRVAHQMTPDAVRDLDDMLAAQTDAAIQDDPQPFMALDEAFHRKLADLAGQGAGWDFLQPIKSQMDRVRHLSAQQFPRRVLVQQHRHIVDAIRSGDADMAEQTMRRHLRQILEDVPVVAAARPEFFEPERI